ncbi:hypothetical protein WICPIJ_010020 [Wickerhamomyces pijperi]|uniref:TFIIS N-terminal domain-containing protein n=1 Tax=Wickerhamomyces pijperi TaxID=599730 RepID=A0A9P8TBQ5_WICPI|nr:hypothetical protein WICPIJ_010020 [Wickerhamomyces pijperi]
MSDTEDPQNAASPAAQAEEQTTTAPVAEPEQEPTAAPSDQEGDNENENDDEDQAELRAEAAELADDDYTADVDFSSLKARKRSNVGATVDKSASATAHSSVTPPALTQAPTRELQSNSTDSFDETQRKRRELEERLDRALKKPKVRRRKDEHDLTNDDDEVIQILKQQMENAAKLDSELIANESGIAVNKIQLLPKVRSVLNKVNLYEVILDNNLLAEIRQWLEPLPDASLPSYEIQKELFAALVKLPINTNHLRESGIGKILLFYQKSKRVEPKIKRVADKLISDWTRPIIGASDNYRDKKFHSRDFDHSSLRRRKSSTGAAAANKLEKSIYEQQAERRNRAAAPAPTVTDYKFVPKSRIDASVTNNIANAGVGSSLNRDDQFKRINSKLSGRANTGRVSKKGGISIEGRGLH